MTDAGDYYLFHPEGGAPRGPFSLENLVDMAEVQALTPDTRVAMDPHVGSTPIHEIPELHAILFPPKPQWTVRERQAHDDAREAGEPVDVLSILRENRSMEGPDARTYAPAQAGGRRKRDFLLLMALTWGGGIGGLALTGLNPVSLVFTLSLVTLATAGMSWLFFVVLDY